MLLKLVSVAICAAIFSVGAANAQTLKQINGPNEPPPAGFKGQMFVDSKGCVFLRAGYGGNVTWVPRVNSAHKVLCGYPSTVAAMAAPVEVVPAAVATTPPAPKATGKPMETVASLTTAPKIGPKAAVQSTVVAQPAKAAVPVILPSAASGRKIGCYTSAPVPKLVALRSGGTAVLCTRGDGTLEGARAPIYAVVAQGVGARVGAGLYSGAAAERSGNAVAVTVDVADAPVVVPKGYKLAWNDDRLNPKRAHGTAAGQAAQDQVWTRDVPATLVADGPVRVIKVVKQGRVVVSTMNAAPAPRAATAGGLYVQIGTFGVQSNADGAKVRLRAAGMPVGSANITKAGKPMQIVLAGPFGDGGQAQAALAAVRSAGFGDAFIR